jgi:molybdate transport system substrate-binding protein
MDVRAVLTKVVLGDADAGFVYDTDARAEKSKLRLIPIPKETNVRATYLIAPLNRPARGKAFTEFALGAKGRAVMALYGFQPPTL